MPASVVEEGSPGSAVGRYGTTVFYVDLCPLAVELRLVKSEPCWII
jgi:hypothetical protein